MHAIELIIVFYGACVFLALVLYAPRLLGFRYGFKTLPPERTDVKRRIAVLIPARNESQIINDLFTSLDAQDYDPACFETFVIVKEPDDPTIALAEAKGYAVTVVPDQHCKGDALHGFFEKLPKDKLATFDAFVIVDADGVLSPTYLGDINRALENDADIFVTRKQAKNFLRGRNNRTLFSNCAALTYPMADALGNAYRTVKHMPLNPCGQGLVVRRHLIEASGGWPYRSITEDYELKMVSLLKGYRSVYTPHAVIYTEEALSHKENFIRRVRWLTGYRQNVTRYRRQIIAKVKAEKRLDRATLEYFFGVVPYFVYLLPTVFMTLGGIGYTLYCAVVRSALWLPALLGLVVLPLGLTYLLLLGYSWLAFRVEHAAFQKITVRERIAMLLYSPIYTFEYLFAYIVGVFQVWSKRVLKWKQTERTAPDGESNHA